LYFVPVYFVLLQNCFTRGDRKASLVLTREQEEYGDLYSLKWCLYLQVKCRESLSPAHFYPQFFTCTVLSRSLRLL